MSEERNPLSLHSEQFDTKDSNSISDLLSVNQEAKTQRHAENRIVLLHENETNWSPAVRLRNQRSVVKLDNETGTHSEKEIFSSSFGEGQNPNGIGHTENDKGVGKRSSTDERETLCEKAR